MTLALADRNSRATIAAAEAQAALAAGDTDRARERYETAGKSLEEGVAAARKQSEKHLLRFLAATQYYKGGHYAKALELCKKIEQRLLPLEVRSLFPAFLKDVKARAAVDYESSVRQKLNSLSAQKKFGQIIALLQEHPYILSAGELALARASACEQQKNYQAAAAFYADAIRMNPGDATTKFQNANPVGQGQPDRPRDLSP